jgi:hypothetical protein
MYVLASNCEKADPSTALGMTATLDNGECSAVGWACFTCPIFASLGITAVGQTPLAQPTN